MPLPDTMDDLAEAGYQHEGRWRCPTCRQLVERFRTPNKKFMGFSFKAGSQTQLEPHAAVCDSNLRRKAG